MNTFSPTVQQQHKKTVKFSLFANLTLAVILCLLGMTLLQNKSASASVTLNPNPGPIPAFIYNYLINSDTYPQTPAYAQWLSQAGSPATTTVNVNWGQTSVPLDFHFSGAIGWEPQSAAAAEVLLVSASSTSGTVTGIGGQVFPYAWWLENYVGAYAHNSQGLTFYPSSAIQQDTTIFITVVTRPINLFPGNTYQCVAWPNNFVSGWDFNSCNPTQVTVPINIHVINPSPPKVQISCDASANPSGAIISWTGTPGNYLGINWVVEIDDNNNWGDGFYNKAVLGTTPPYFTSAPAGFNPVAPKTGSLSLVKGNTYYTRVTNGQYSKTTQFLYACPSIALTVNGQHSFPTPLEVGDPISVAWFPKNVVSCTATGNWSGNKSPAGIGSPENHNGDSSTPGFKDYKITCLDSSGNSVTDEVSLYVAAKPYMRVYGGDVLAGSGFGDSCTPTASPGSGIIGWNNGGGGNYSGAGVQFAAESTGNNLEFTSASLRSGVPNPPPNGLTFSNTSGDVNWGGGFGDAPCASDYFANSKGLALTNSGGVNVQTLSTGSYLYNPSPIFELNAPSNGAVSTGTHVVIYVNGDIRIKHNITYDSAGWTATKLPSLYIIAKGNIYIDSSVTQLDGIYIAQPADPNNTSANDGRIYTCSQGSVPYSDSGINNNCKSPLTINGALVANRVVFGRINGTLKNAASGDSNVAEIINFSPEVWLVDPQLNSSLVPKIDSVTSLPPVL